MVSYNYKDFLRKNLKQMEKLKPISFNQHYKGGGAVC